ncbi:MAG: sensor histidine kinase [Alicyclobacillus macrosporangiidus]|uniref:sensor histidine kinase n=1 Tax=Alicyclobacillus macrosporangiidus TaxID=392015 RepID=UPI0026F27B57|nr:sensor histidine kinase [Alicyclobacillus macrosporangiidus]MCL6599972.1 sensor histidine kinase [Alicyclobacillus macrosporangiidus]
MRPFLWLLRWIIWMTAVITLAVTHPTLDTAAVCAVAAAVFSGTSAVLASHSSHPAWPQIRGRTVWVEGVISWGLTAWFSAHAEPDVRLLVVLWTPPGTAAGLALGERLQWGLDGAAALGVVAAVVSAVRTVPLPVLTVVWTYLPYLMVSGLVVACEHLWRILCRERTLHRAALEEVRRRTEQVSRYNEQVNEYAERVHRLAAAEERNRIAGVIHDTVAHRLTALFVQLQAARRVLAQGDSAAAVGNLEVCEVLAQESLADVRRSVHALRSQVAGEGVEALRRLAIQYGAMTGMEVRFDAGGVEILPMHCLGVFYRAIQEGLTNAHRHGRATIVTIRLRMADGMVMLDVSDNGRGAKGALAGFGLSTMRERVQRLGGDVHADTRPGQGFRLQVWVPVLEG